jgi:diguanylate cyclase (GGDEF)-like protein/PAS domain S-box-containing protein
LTARTPAGVPVSDPFAEVRVLKMWARLGVYTAIAAFSPIDVYVMGFSLAQLIYVQTASVAVATAAIELTFRQSLKLRRRSAYPGSVVVEAGASASLVQATATSLNVLQRLLRVRNATLIDDVSDGGAYRPLAASPEAAAHVAAWLGPHARVCLESATPAFVEPDEAVVATGALDNGESVVLIPVLAFARSIGVFAAIGQRRSRDLRDTELLSGIGSAMGLALENHRQKEEIQAKEERLRAVVTAAPVLLFRTDASGVLTLLEGRALERLNVSPEQVIGRSAFEVFAGLPRVVEDFKRALAGETVRATAEVGSTIFEAELCPIKDAAGRVTSVIGVATDITERKHAEDTIRHMAYHDSLTGLPNRELFERTLTERLSEAAHHRNMLSVLFVDLDGFKAVNDTVGHAEGDRFLKAVADQLTRLVRADDFVARIGGDEFLILLPEIKSLDEAIAVSDRVLAGLNVDSTIGDRLFRITASIGVAVFPVDGRDSESLLRSADRAMYEAKSQGKARYALIS